MVAKSLVDAYRFFRTHAGRRVGRSAEGAIVLARAEAFAAAHGWEIRLEDEQERYEDVYGEPAPSSAEFVCVIAYDEAHEIIGSLGFVDVRDRDYVRVVAAELFAEAYRTTHAPGRSGAMCEERVFFGTQKPSPV